MRKEQIFTGITSQGGLLPADFLAALSDPKSGIDGLDPLSYRLAPGERLGEQVNRSWNRLKGCWANFQRALASKDPGDPTTSETRERWLLPLFQELDFGRLTAAKPLELDGRTYAVSHGWGPVPIHLVGSHVDLDRRTPGAVGAAKASPHSLVQQMLNASDDHLWGIISNGFILRLLRDNLALTRQAFVEWDLQAIFDGDLYPEFFLLWVVCHQSRFEVSPGGLPEQCWLEKWRKQAEDTGLRALENLRPGVEQAIAALGTGLISHKSNQALREKLSSGQLSTQDFYRQILRLIYRLLFLLVAEDRNLLHPPLPSEEAAKDALDRTIQARRRYDEFYSIGRLRFLTRRRAGTPHPDLWQVLQFVTGKLGSDVGCPELALPALGSFLWNAESTPDLNQCLVSNRNLLEAVHSLAYIRDGDVRRIIDYKNLGSEELGSVYESLLELHPIVNADIGTFELQTAAGHERKTSGSYYTPDSLVQCLLDSALEPVMDEAVKGKEGPAAAQALLELKICDPAVGSGHFLIAAAHRLAKRIAVARTGEEEPSPEATRTALRDVIGRCLYGVDVNPMAAELCRVSLWVEALEPGKPLSFLDHHIQAGNSLLGSTPEHIAAGLPDQAFISIEGDHKEICKNLRNTNKRECSGQGTLFDKYGAGASDLEQSFAHIAGEINSLSDETPAAVQQKQERYDVFTTSTVFQRQKFLANSWCAAFVWKKTTSFKYGITTGVLQTIKTNPDSLEPWMIDEVRRLSNQYRFFHWNLAFPEVFSQGGFDCVLGNPPWERVSLEEKQWFAERRPEIANAPTGAIRKSMIEHLKISDPDLYRTFLEDLREAEGESHLLRNSGLYPLCGCGRVNLYAVFAERMLNLLGPSGQLGAVLPSGIATDDTTKLFFQEVVNTSSLQSFFDFENRNDLFPGVHREQKFCLFTCRSTNSPTTVSSSSHFDFSFFCHGVEDLKDPRKLIKLSADDIALLNPNTCTCPIFRSRLDAELTKSIYRRVPVLVNEGHGNINNWAISFKQGLFNMTTDSNLFSTFEQLEADGWRLHGNKLTKGEDEYLPLYEGKLTYLFDHRAGTFGGCTPRDIQTGNERSPSDEEKSDPSFFTIPRFWVPFPEVQSAFGQRVMPSSWLTFHDIVNPNNERTFIVTIVPFCGVGNVLPILLQNFSRLQHGNVFLCSNLSASIFDYVARLKINSRHCNFFIVKQLPVLPPHIYSEVCKWNREINSLGDWILPRMLELIYNAWDQETFANDCGLSCPPFKWNGDRRFLLRCELDAAFFLLYLPPETNRDWRIASKADDCPFIETTQQLAELKEHFPTPRDAVAYIMDTFPIVRRRDEEKYDGNYRTKRVILEIYDAMQESIRTGRPYQTRLDPPPGPPCDKHGHFLSLPDWKPGQPRPADWPPHIHPPRGVLAGS